MVLHPIEDLMKTVPSLLLPGVEPRELTAEQLLAREAYQQGILPRRERTRKVVSKETARENSRIMQQRLDSFVAATSA